MIQMVNKLKKNQKGFTLVELIVVLVILAILAAFTIPAMLGFVDDARGKAAIAQAREVYMAYSTSVSEVVAGGDATTAKSYTHKFNEASPLGPTAPATDSTTEMKIQKGAFSKLSGDITNADGTALQDASNVAWLVTVTNGKVSEIKYWKDGYQITLDTSDDGGEAIVEKIKDKPTYATT